MFFISSKRDNRYGVVDTSDWVEEFYTKEQIQNFQRSGIVIESAKVQKDIVDFYWYFVVTAQDVGSSTMDLVVDFMKGECTPSAFRCEIGSSTMDIVVSLKNLYLEIKKIWNDINIDAFGRNDKFYIDMEFLINASRQFSRSKLEQDFEEFSRDYHIDISVLKSAI